MKTQIQRREPKACDYATMIAGEYQFCKEQKCPYKVEPEQWAGAKQYGDGLFCRIEKAYEIRELTLEDV